MWPEKYLRCDANNQVLKFKSVIQKRPVTIFRIALQLYCSVPYARISAMNET